MSLYSDLNEVLTPYAQRIKGLITSLGNLSNLETTDKSSIVAAINEAAQSAGNASSQLKADLADLSSHVLAVDISTAGGSWYSYKIVAGHKYLLENSKTSTGIIQLSSTNGNNYNYVETFTPYHLTAGNKISFRATLDANNVYVYTNNASSFKLIDLTALESVQDTAGNIDKYQKYNIENVDLTGQLKWVYGASISESGAVSSAATFRYTDLIPVASGTYTVMLTSKTASTINTRVHGYNSEGTWVKQLAMYSVAKIGDHRFSFEVDSTVSNIRISTGYEENISEVVLVSGVPLGKRITEIKFDNSLIGEEIASGNNWRPFDVRAGHAYRISNVSTGNTKIAVNTTNGNNYTYIDTVNNGALIPKGQSVEFTATKDATTLYIYATSAAVIDVVEITSISSLYSTSIAHDEVLESTSKTYDHVVRNVNRIAFGFSAPMQSIEGYKQAYKAGFRNLLCDVRFTSDNVPVCFHDSYFNEVFNMVMDNSGNFVSTTPPVYVADVPSTDLPNYDVGKYKEEKYAGTRILTLEKMLYFCKCLGVTVYLEMKVSPTTAQYDILFGLIRDYGMEEFTVWAPQTIEQLNSLTTYEPNVYIQFHSNTAGVYTDMPDSYITAIVGKVNQYNRGRVTITVPSSVDITDAQLKTLSDAGVGICTGSVSDEAYLLAYLARGRKYHAFHESLSDYIVVGKYLYEYVDDLIS